MDLKFASTSLGITAPPRPLRLPRIDEPLVGAETKELNASCSGPPLPIAEPAQILRPDAAEQFVHDAIRDNAALDLEFLNGRHLRGTPTGTGSYSLRLRTSDDSELIVFHQALRSLRRAAATPNVNLKRPPRAKSEGRQARGKSRPSRPAKRS